MRADRAALAAVTAPPLEGLVWAFRFTADGTPQPLANDQPFHLDHDSWYWLHFNLADARAVQWLGHAELPPAARDLLLSKDSFQQLHGTEDCVHGVIADLARDIGGSTEEAGRLRFVMTERLLVSGRHHALHAVDVTRRALESGQRVPSAAVLFERIVENVAEAMEHIVDGFEQQLDEIEEKLLSEEGGNQLPALGRLRRTCIRVHRHLSELRVVLHRFDRNAPADIRPALQVRARNLAERLDGLDHMVVELRDRSRLLQEELHLQMEEQTNNSLRVLSVLTALLLPPTLVTGIFGMNTKGLPFTDSETGFISAVVLMALAALGSYVLMKRIGLIR
ncbi:transporter [Bradyrhizobium oligotrophicum]|uniref:transporter n=1 Tax=Bradyrhizobium oligotrophicum TaxID=44255 RepID=UPI003EBCB979